MALLEKIEELDRNLFLSLNSCHNSFLDTLMYNISGTFIWIPFYLFIAYLIFRYHGNKVFYILPVIGLMIFLSDNISVYAFKEVFERLRPCHNIDLKSIVHTVNGKCGGEFGFVSSHAANTFALATFSSFLIRKRWYITIIFLWAALVSYSRIYLGVHYPADVACGAIIGILIGLGCFYAQKFVIKKILKQKND